MKTYKHIHLLNFRPQKLKDFESMPFPPTPDQMATVRVAVYRYVNRIAIKLLSRRQQKELNRQLLAKKCATPSWCDFLLWVGCFGSIYSFYLVHFVHLLLFQLWLLQFVRLWDNCVLDSMLMLSRICKCVYMHNIKSSI